MHENIVESCMLCAQNESLSSSEVLKHDKIQLIVG